MAGKLDVVEQSSLLFLFDLEWLRDYFCWDILGLLKFRKFHLQFQLTRLLSLTERILACSQCVLLCKLYLQLKLTRLVSFVDLTVLTLGGLQFGQFDFQLELPVSLLEIRLFQLPLLGFLL